MKVGDILICIKDNIYEGNCYAFVNQRFKIINIDDEVKIIDIKCIDTEHPKYSDIKEHSTIWFYEETGQYTSDIEYIWKFFISRKRKADKIRNVAKYFLKK